MKRIVCFTESLGGGGAEHQMVLLAGLLSEQGYNVRLITYASLPDHYDIPTGVERKEIGSTYFKSNTLKAIIKVIKVFHYFLWVKTDVVISYRECANLRVLPPMFLRDRKIKVICSDRNTSVGLTFKHKLLLNILYHRANFIVPNSITETEYLTLVKPQLKQKLRTIHNYTDIHQFAVSAMPRDLSVIKVAIFARYSPQKNPVGLAIAMKQVKQRCNHLFEIHWYGTQTGEIDGYNNDYLGVKQKIEFMGLEDVVLLHPAVKNPADEMDRYHAVCLPSLFEGFSNSIAEGICCAKPMLVSDVSDNSVMVHNGENGFLFDPTNADSICDAFINFFDLSYDEMCKMSKRSREIAESLFDKSRFIDQYIDLIES